jgi:hypothetical protein
MRFLRSVTFICGFVALSGLLPISTMALAKYTASIPGAAQINAPAATDDLFTQFGVAP